jgi:hypothetical protein
MVDWRDYLAPWIDRIIPGTAEQFMYVVGGVEIVAGVLVLLSPRWGSLVVAGWLGAIILNLLTAEPPEYYDIALRDFGLLLGALTLNRLQRPFEGRASFRRRSDRASRREFMKNSHRIVMVPASVPRATPKRRDTSGRLG